MKTRSLFLSLLYLIMTFPLHSQWVHTDSLTSQEYQISVHALAASGDNLFAGTSSGVYRTTDYGSSWTEVNSGLVLAYQQIFTVAAFGANLYAGLHPTAGVYVSTNNGTSWTQTGLKNTGIYSLAAWGTDLYAGSQYGSLSRSTDGGANWNYIALGLTSSPANALLVTLRAPSGANLFAGFGGAGVYLTTNSGTTWAPLSTGMTDKVVKTLASAGTILFAGTGGGSVYRSTDNGSTWIDFSAGLAGGGVGSFAVSDTTLFATTDLGGVYRNSVNGAVWSTVNTGLPAYVVAKGLAIAGPHLFVGTYAYGIYRRPLSELVTGVDDQTDSRTPVQFSLAQNYPNPFNPTTTISYDLPVDSRVCLRVYDMLGQAMATLAESEQNAGHHEVVFDASALASGAYLYRLQAGEFVRAMKLMLVR